MRSNHLGRRELITLLGGAAVLPVAARAQQASIPVIGSLSSLAPAEVSHLIAVFRQTLNESGHVEGRNVTMEYRWAHGQYDRLPTITLASVLARAAPGLRLNEHIEGDGPTVFLHACRLGLEGIVSKRKDSRYSSGRSPHWIKSKNPNAAAVKREAEEEWGQWSRTKVRAATNHP